MICPKCGRRMSWYIDGLIRPGIGSRICPWCQTKLELLHGNYGLFFASILLAGGLFVVYFFELPFQWVWVCLLGVVFWLLMPVWMRIFGKLIVSSYTREQQIKAMWLDAEIFASTITMAAWVLYMVLTLIIPYARIISEFNPNVDQSWQNVEDYTEAVKDRILSTRGIIELGVGILSLIWCRVNILRRMYLRKQSIEDKLGHQIQKPNEAV
jgi:hypothetical protein